MHELDDLSIFHIYKKLIRKSEQLDVFIKDKMYQIKESFLQPPIKLKHNLRIKISSKFDEDGSKWTLRIAGRVMTINKSEVLDPQNNLKMLQYFDKIFIEFEKSEKTSYMNIDWRKLNNLYNRGENQDDQNSSKL